MYQMLGRSPTTTGNCALDALMASPQFLKLE